MCAWFHLLLLLFFFFFDTELLNSLEFERDGNDLSNLHRHPKSREISWVIAAALVLMRWLLVGAWIVPGWGLLTRKTKPWLCCCSVVQSCPTLCDSIDCRTPAFPVFYHFPELVQTHVHWVSDVIQTSHPLSSPSPPAFQSFPALGSFLTNWVIVSGGQNIGTSASASVFSMNIQNWFPLGLTGFITLLSKEFLRVFSNSTV